MKPRGVEDYPSRKPSSGGLRSPNLLAQHPIVGLILFIVGSLVFGLMAYDLLAHGPLLAWDQTLATTLPAIALHSPAYIRPIMNAGFHLGEEVIVAAGVLLGLYLLYKRCWQEFVMLAVGLVGALSLYIPLTTFFGRARPPTQLWIVITNFASFPSGHANASVAFYGLLAYLLVPRIRRNFWKAIAIAMATLLILFIGFSRIFTGGHYLTDVLAGYGLGIAWSGAIYTLIEIIFQKIGSRKAAAEQTAGDESTPTNLVSRPGAEGLKPGK